MDCAKGEKIMARPAGTQRSLKDNSKKNYRVREEWMQGKRIGRPKQRWVPDEVMSDVVTRNILGTIPGHWEKVK